MGAADVVRGARRTHGARGPTPAPGRPEPRLARGFRGTPGPTLAPVTPTIGIIGLGYVGLPLAVAFAQADCEVIAVDVDSRKIESIGARESYIVDVPGDVLHGLASRIHPTTPHHPLHRS